ncbi:sigma 54-interacting transcriptional regulator [Desulfosporosinus sp.]|uniref:sigma 54-interacting transcriptional regulator n=1 Tax=Desulfosporosinus sp. TaxID=157907 RepID=UPI0023109422|nr:sigma 54-interacting transcriptional regulator [Desulfosporosinus sp.]MDA8223628.1 sigma 54-interacting transcriptional regulator [Desulfitobacterium hafniense]
MKVKQIMLENPRTLHYSKTIQDASHLYRQTKVNCAPIVDDEDNVVGILTVFRLLEAIEEGATFATRVDQIMERNLQIIDENTSFHDIREQTMDRLLIFNTEQQLTGVLTRIDLINKVHGALMNSEHKLAEVSEINKELRSVIEASYDGIIVVDSHGLVQIVNKSFYRVQGSDHDPMGERIEQLAIMCRELLIQVYQRVMANGKVTFDRYKGKYLTELAITGSPVLDEQDRLVRVVISIRDLTELNQLKLQSERYSHELKSLRAKEQKDLIYHSSAMERVVNEALRVSGVNSTVLITGESGVGKEVIAKTIHQNSPRAEGPFIQINGGAIPENLLESELFGYEKGSFTGANKEGKPGMMELANGGTLLLDEVGDMPLNLQVKLLRAIQEQEIYRIGGRVPIKLNIRILSATNKNLEILVKEKKFREDLFYRLNVVPIKIPPLRERKSDILPLAKHFLDKVNERYKMQKYFSYEICKLFEEYNWPGNIRELANLVERLVIMSEQDAIFPDQLPEPFFAKFSSSSLRVSVDQIIPLKEARDIVETKLIIKALKEYNSLRRAGEVLGVAHSTLLRKARSLGISYSD